jgi:hypothetical protein
MRQNRALTGELQRILMRISWIATEAICASSRPYAALAEPPNCADDWCVKARAVVSADPGDLRAAPA